MKRMMAWILTIMIVSCAALSLAEEPPWEKLKEHAETEPGIEYYEDGDFKIYDVAQVSNGDPGPDGEILRIILCLGRWPNMLPQKPLLWVQVTLIDQEGQDIESCVPETLTFTQDGKKYCWDRLYVNNMFGPCSPLIFLDGECDPFVRHLADFSKGSVTATYTVDGQKRTRTINDSDNLANFRLWAEDYLRYDFPSFSDMPLMERLSKDTPMVVR